MVKFFTGVFFGHQGFRGDYMCSYVSFVGKSSIRGIEIKMGGVSAQMSVHLDLEILIFMFDIILAAIQKMHRISLIFSLVVVPIIPQ